LRAGACGIALLVLAGCATRPPASDRDGPPASPPPNLGQVPDAEPRIEPLRVGGPNKPYTVLGQRYEPLTSDQPLSERGGASWYGRKFHGKRTASGEVYNMYAMTAAHPTMPLPSYARVRNPANGREVVVRVNDRGPFHPGRIIDLSYTEAVKLGVQRGVAPVEVQRITNDEIRSGAWKRDGASNEAVAAGSTSAPVAVAAELPAPPPVRERGDAEATATTLLPPAGSTVRGGASAEPGRAYTVPARGYWVQLGAFRERGGAESFQQRVGAELDWLAPLMAVFADASLFRLQAGPYPSRDEAQGAAQRVREALSLVPVVVERK
jgi:rare lipoprotein A